MSNQKTNSNKKHRVPSKGDGLESLVVAGLEVVSEEGLNILESMSPLGWDVDLLREEPICCKPLSSCCPVVHEVLDCLGSMISEWVLWRVKGFRHIVGLSCEGFEE